jgi:hypothetical protein
MSRTSGAAPSNQDSATYQRLVARARKSLSSNEIAALTGVQARQVQNWAAGASRPERRAGDRLLDLDYLISLLEEVYTDEGVEIWLHARNRSLHGRRPLDVLAEDYGSVLAAVERLTTGAM